MPSQHATQLAKNILDDLRGATYYADPKILGGLLRCYGICFKNMLRVVRRRKTLRI